MNYDIKPQYREREQEFRAMTRAWILKKNAQFIKSAEHLKNTPPIRHPKGAAPARGHTLERLWSDSIWCQDSTLDPFLEFFEIDDGSDEYDRTMDGQGCDQEADWANKIFNDEFNAVLPELAHVLEG